MTDESKPIAPKSQSEDSQDSTTLSENDDDSKEVISQEFKFAGPIPPPGLLEAYEKVLEGSADRILKRAESQTTHRQSMEQQSLSLEKQRLSNSHSEVRMGQISGLIIGVVAIGSALYAALNGAEIYGGFIGTTSIIGLVSAFIYGSKRKQKDHQE